MKTQLYSISKIFTERVLRIPDYQRGYAWTEKQLKDFWGDLLQLEDGKNHYTGVLTLEEVPEHVFKTWSDDLWIIQSKSYAPLYVVDGQQRLTTAIILVQCITESVPTNIKLNYTSIIDIRRKFIYDSKDEGISRSYLFGYEQDNPSYEFLKRKIFQENSDDSSPIQETIYTYNLEIARSFFLERLNDLDIEEKEKLYKKLTQHLLFNVYSISDDVDVFVAFETMNNRGKPLSHLELLKNRLIFLSTKFDTNEHEKIRLRNAVNGSWKAIYHYLGKNKQNPLDDDIFLYNHFVLYFGDDYKRIAEEYAIVQRHRFIRGDGYKDYLLEKKFTLRSITTNGTDNSDKISIKDVYLYVQSLKDSVETWYQLLNPQDSSFSEEEKVWLGKLNRLRILHVAPLIMVFYQREQSSKNRIRLLRTLERYLFVLSLLDRYAVPDIMDRSDFMSYSSQLMKGETNPEKLIKDVENQTDALIERPDFNAFVTSNFRSRGFYSWSNIRYFLYEYESDLKGRSKTHRTKLEAEYFFPEDSRDYSTVEHIYPQRPRNPCWVDAFKHYTDKEKNSIRNSLGNLLPLSQPKNSSFKNKCFDDKKGDNTTMIGFHYGSYSENEVANYKQWTANEILERGMHLINFMERRWKLSFGTQQDKLKLLGLEFVPAKERTTLKT